MHLDYEGPIRYYKVEYEQGVHYIIPIDSICNFIYNDGRQEEILPTATKEKKQSF